MTVATATELWRMSATELAEAIRSRQASSQEVIEAHLRRIEAVNPSINAVVIVLGEEALEAAKVADRAVARGDELPPLHGVPFTVKENIDVAGTPTTQGLKALANAYPTRDAPIVERTEERRGDRHRPHEPAQRCHALALRERAVGSDHQSLGQVPDTRRVQCWRGRRDRDGHEPAGPRQRWPRIAAPPRAVLRNQRAEADPGSGPAGEHRRAGGMVPDRRPADGRQRAARPTCRRPPRSLRDRGRADLARPVDRAGAAPRP